MLTLFSSVTYYWYAKYLGTDGNKVVGQGDNIT